MRKLGLLITLYLAFGFVFAWSDKQTLDEKAELFRKKEGLLKLVPSKGRIIIAGGSNAFWGMSSVTLQQMSNRPVVNISIPSEIDDPALMRSLTLRVVKPGDLVVYSSMEFWIKPEKDVKKAIKIASRLHDQNYIMDHIDSLSSLADWWKPFPTEVNPATALARTFWMDPGEDTWSSFMDSHGDYQECNDLYVSPIPFELRTDPSQYQADIQRFRQELKERDAVLVTTAPWILISEDEKELWKTHYIDLMQKVNPAHTAFSVGHPDLVLRLDQSEFCDCAWHLKRSMGIERSKTYLKNQIEEALILGFHEKQKPKDAHRIPKAG